MVAAEALRNGADDYFTKDIEFAQYQRIVNSIRRVVNTKGERNKQVALELEARRFKQILDQANHGNVILNVEEEVIYANNMFASMHGEKLEELVGRPMIDFVSDRSRDQYQVLKGLIFKQGSTPPMKMWHKRGDDGSEFPAIGSAILFRSEGGEPENIVFTFMGISHKNQAMKFMEENQQNFRRLIEEGPIAYQSLDNQGRFVSVNGKWLELFGYSKEEVLGKHFEEFLTGEEIASFTEHFKSMATQGEVHNSTYKIVDFQGQARKMDIFGRISFNEKGEFIQTNCILIKAESD